MHCGKPWVCSLRWGSPTDPFPFFFFFSFFFFFFLTTWHNWALTAETKKSFRSCWRSSTQKAINLPAPTALRWLNGWIRWSSYSFDGRPVFGTLTKNLYERYNTITMLSSTFWDWKSAFSTYILTLRFRFYERFSSPVTIWACVLISFHFLYI